MYLVSCSFHLHTPIEQPMTHDWRLSLRQYFDENIRTVSAVMPPTPTNEHIGMQLNTMSSWLHEGNYNDACARSLPKPCSRVSLVAQWGRVNATSMKPNTYLNSAKCEDSGESNFYGRKRIFQKTKKLSSSFSMWCFLIFPTETGWILST